jgi:hypothetical protein
MARDPHAGARIRRRPPLVLLFLLPVAGCQPAADPVPAADGNRDIRLPDRLQWNLPTALSRLPEQTGRADDDRALFNHFSWQQFIALNWPAKDSGRGIPDTAKSFGDRAERVVWETWKSLGELYPGDPDPTPSEWDSFATRLSVRLKDESKEYKQYPLQLKDVDPKAAGKVRLFQSFVRFNDTTVNQAGFVGIPNGPLVSRNCNFVRFETRINQHSYEFIRANRFYLKEELDKQKDVVFPEQSVHVKTAWMVLSQAQVAGGRFHHVRARAIVNWSGTVEAPQFELRELDFGLVGMHIVQKTKDQKDWIWSTFEHVDNLQSECSRSSISSFQSSDPPAEVATTNRAPLDALFVGRPFPKSETVTPTEVFRVVPIHPTTDAINASYATHRDIRETRWRHYRLLGTQWPAKGTRIADSLDNRRPNQLANVTLETYSQGRSCLECHSGAFSLSHDYVFYPRVHARESALRP